MNGIIIAGGNLIVEDGKILLVRETLKEIEGKWNLPVGRINTVEDIIACAEREGKEETGFNLKTLYLIGVFQHIAKRHNIILFVFRSEINGGELAIPKDIMDVQWFLPEQIREMQRQDLLVGSYILDVLECHQKNQRFPLSLISVLRES